ncbi:hypothetical protein CRUP_009305 [Coryphaenoides rupestris]|nr:hypothetical protein CRUP_009305 [Coryphaenoides rupestris]
MPSLRSLSAAIIRPPPRPIGLRVVAECPVTKARACDVSLPHAALPTPVFMPVGTQGTMKGITTQQLDALGCQICLGNTYHLGMRPEGVKFTSPYDGSEILLTPEKSIEIQNSLGSDIMMQLDDVVSSTVTGPRVEEAMHRSVRWLDRCIAANRNPERQNLFAIIQGGLSPDLRRACLDEMTKRDVSGFAIGGLSGGEEKDDFWKMLPGGSGRLRGSGLRYRFGSALVPWGSLQVKHKQYAKDFQPIDPDCQCPTCKSHSRAYLHALFKHDTAAMHHVTIHNISYQLSLMRSVRQSIVDGRFPEFVRSFMKRMFPPGERYPRWAVDALASVNVTLDPH